MLQQLLHAVSLLLLSGSQCHNNMMCACKPSNGGMLGFDETPISVIALNGEHAEFRCTVTNGFIIWLFGDSFLFKLPPKTRNDVADVYSFNGTHESSVLTVFATEVTNNSNIVCGFDVRGMNRSFSSPALLLVQDEVTAPVNVSAVFSMTEMAVDLSWTPPFVLSIPNTTLSSSSQEIISFFIVNACSKPNCTNSTEFETNETDFRFSLEEHNMSVCNLSQLEFTVHTLSRLGNLSDGSAPTSPEIQDSQQLCDASLRVPIFYGEPISFVLTLRKLYHYDLCILFMYYGVAVLLILKLEERLNFIVGVSVGIVMLIIVMTLRAMVLVVMCVRKVRQHKYQFESDDHADPDTSTNECYATNARTKRCKAYQRTNPRIAISRRIEPDGIYDEPEDVCPHESMAHQESNAIYDEPDLSLCRPAISESVIQNRPTIIIESGAISLSVDGSTVSPIDNTESEIQAIQCTSESFSERIGRFGNIPTSAATRGTCASTYTIKEEVDNNSECEQSSVESFVEPIVYAPVRDEISKSELAVPRLKLSGALKTNKPTVLVPEQESNPTANSIMLFSNESYVLRVNEHKSKQVSGFDAYPAPVEATTAHVYETLPERETTAL